MPPPLLPYMPPPPSIQQSNNIPDELPNYIRIPDAPWQLPIYSSMLTTTTTASPVISVQQQNASSLMPIVFINTSSFPVNSFINPQNPIYVHPPIPIESELSTSSGHTSTSTLIPTSSSSSSRFNQYASSSITPSSMMTSWSTNPPTLISITEMTQSSQRKYFNYR